MESPFKILIVEDEMIIGANISLQLSKLGYEVTGIISKGEDALLHVRQNQPDMIIMDIQLPEVSGVDLIEQAKKDLHLQAIPILAVTAYAARGDEERIRAAGAAGYLSKPVSIGPFMNAVKELLPN